MKVSKAKVLSQLQVVSALVLFGSIVSGIYGVVLTQGTIAGASQQTVQAYQIYNYTDSSYCVDANSNNYDNAGDNIQLFGCNGNVEQQWYVQGNQIMNDDQTECLASSSTGFPKDSDAIELEPCNTSSPEQQWTVEGTGENIKNAAHTGYCIDANSTDYPGTPSNPDQLELWTCADNSRQNWGLEDSQCPDINSVQEYGHQFTSDQTGVWNGESGNFLTPTFSSINSGNGDGTESHLYMEAYYQSLASVEVGVEQGAGAHYSSSSDPFFFYATEDEYGTYNETDNLSPSPTAGDTYAYKIVYNGPIMGTDEGQWTVEWDGQSQGSIDIHGLQGGQPVAGAEVHAPNGTDEVPVDTVGTPDFQLKNTSGTWAEWNTSVGTHFCANNGLSIGYTTDYDNFSVTGDLNP